MARPLTLDRLLTADQQREIVAFRAAGATRRQIAWHLAVVWGIKPTPKQLRVWLEHADRRLERARDMAALEMAFGERGLVRDTIDATAGMLAHAIARKLEAAAELPTAELFVLARAFEHVVKARQVASETSEPVDWGSSLLTLATSTKAVARGVHEHVPDPPETSADPDPPLRNGHDA